MGESVRSIWKSRATQGTNWGVSSWGGFNWATTNLSLSNIRLLRQYFDGETGFNQNWNRYYGPTTGRYVQSDPIGLGSGINSYAYVNANPMSYADPSGLTPAGAALGGRLSSWIAGGLGELIDPAGGAIPGAAIGSVLGSMAGNSMSGRTVAVGTIGFRLMDTPDVPQHGISGPHYNFYKANQNPNNCQCFWQSIGAVSPTNLPRGAIPIEPFAN